jgi:hypothetical protein
VALYQNDKIDNLTITKIAFWNAGNVTINHGDISKVDPIKISILNEKKFLDAFIISTTNPVNQFSISKVHKESSVLLSFDYIDKNEGIVIQVIHTGNSSSDITVSGTLKGMGKPIHFTSIFNELVHQKYLESPSLRRSTFRSIALVIGVLLLIEGLLGPEPVGKGASRWIQFPVIPIPAPYIKLLLIIISILFFVWALIVLREKVPKNLNFFDD